VLAWPDFVSAKPHPPVSEPLHGMLARALWAGDGVGVWCADLDALGAHHAALLDVLPDDERARAAALPDATRRVRFLRARGVLRQLLSEHIGTAAARRPFEYGGDGKPSIAAGAAGSGVQFNLSHARAVALFAIAAGRRVGVDLAWTGGAVPVEKVIARFFSLPERAAVASAPADERRVAFARIWVRKEAYLKGRGEGISEWIYGTDFSRRPDDRHAESGSEAPPPPESGDQGRWEVRDLEALPIGYVGSLAVERGGR